MMIIVFRVLVNLQVFDRESPKIDTPGRAPAFTQRVQVNETMMKLVS